MGDKPWYFRSIENILNELEVKPEEGLSAEEARRRLNLVGYNQLTQQKINSPLIIFFNQFKDFMVIVLLVATLISGFLGEYADALTIMAIVIINAILGFVQEYRAEKSMEALKKLIAPEARVFRSGQEINLPAKELVPGDIVILETGDIIPADLRLLKTVQIEIDESALTGESMPVSKKADFIGDHKIGLGDRKNMAYMGTIVTKGKGLGIVVETGMLTEMGQIAGLIQVVSDEQTPLQMRLEQLGRLLVIFCLLIVIVVVFTGILRGEPIYTMILTGVSLAVAAIPEGLPAIVTIALAVGMQRMVKRMAIVRKLPAVETLGCATVICSDKTGTLTQNEMTVKKMLIADELIEISGEGYKPTGAFQSFQKSSNKFGLELALKIGALCNNSKLTRNEITIPGLFRKENNNWQIMGDPTEGALLVLAAKRNIWKESLEKKETRIYEIPFDSERKMMTVVYQDKQGLNIYTKGAADLILERCKYIMWEGRIIPLDEKTRQIILFFNDQMANEALRVLALATQELKRDINYAENENFLEEDLVFVGLAGMIDPPRQAAIEAIAVCKDAGIKTMMITGDYKLTAKAIAEQLNIIEGNSIILTGSELDHLDERQLEKIIDQVAVYARVSPKHKLRIVKTLKRKGYVVAMTGDGVNDAPAIKEADIGIAMGITGTDVTKEASAMILADDNFATIVNAIEEGRGIYDNIRKFIRYLLSCNVGEVLTMFFAVLFALPLPLLPIQILWINLVTDGLPAMALGVDKRAPDIMTRKPRHPKENIFAFGLARRIALRGLLISFGTLLVFILGMQLSSDLVLARTMALTTLVFSQLFHVFDCRSERYSIFEIGIFGNMFLVAAVACSIIMHLMVIYLPFLQIIFKTQALAALHWCIILAISGGTTLLQGSYRFLKKLYLKHFVYAR